jgi:hypothetical protein
VQVPSAASNAIASTGAGAGAAVADRGLVDSEEISVTAAARDASSRDRQFTGAVVDAAEIVVTATSGWAAICATKKGSVVWR